MESCLDGTDETLKNREVRSVKNKGHSNVCSDGQIWQKQGEYAGTEMYEEV